MFNDVEDHASLLSHLSAILFPGAISSLALSLMAFRNQCQPMFGGRIPRKLHGMTPGLILSSHSYPLDLPAYPQSTPVLNIQPASVLAVRVFLLTVSHVHSPSFRNAILTIGLF